MPLSSQRDDARRRLTVITTGVVTAREIRAMVDRQANDGTWSYAMLYDASRVTSIATTGEVRALAHHVQALERTHGPRGPVAVLTNQDAIYGMSRMYSMSAQQQLVEVFREAQAAERWLTGMGSR
jgi:hypothetical protein